MLIVLLWLSLMIVIDVNILYWYSELMIRNMFPKLFGALEIVFWMMFSAN